jgi:hypothetical protein
MVRVARIVGYGAATVAFAACAQLAGLSDYSAGDARSDARLPEASAGPDDAADLADGTSEAAPEASGPSTFACSRGGCNSPNRVCHAAGHCYCAADNDCKVGKCVSVPGQNDVSCGTSCSGSGTVDGFNCQLTCASGAFGYIPSNFAPGSYTAPAGATTDCNATYDSSQHKFTTGSCAGQAPTIAPSVAQPGGGHPVDILVFKSLTIAGTLRLVGSDPVILAVYGDATIQGTVDASASGSTPGAGGNSSCATANKGTGSPDNLWEPGAGGGGQAASGGAGGASRGGNGGAAGVAQGTGAVPLTGGCAGALPYAGNSLNYTPSASAGGGGVQISVAGALDVSTGTIKVNGSNGGHGEDGACGGSSPAQNGTGGAGGGAAGTILLEGATVKAGTYQATGGPGGKGGAAPSPNSQAGGVGAAGGAAGNPGTAGGDGTQNGTAPSGCNSGSGIWSGGGGGGGAGGYVKTNVAGGACLCKQDSDCSTGACSNVANQCTGMCSGSTVDGTYDTVDCQFVDTVSAP